VRDLKLPMGLLSLTSESSSDTRVREERLNFESDRAQPAIGLLSKGSMLVSRLCECVVSAESTSTLEGMSKARKRARAAIDKNGEGECGFEM